jgi:rSAM/selenodomain-associated transferase 1
MRDERKTDGVFPYPSSLIPHPFFEKQGTLLVFLKYPSPGRVKTRLAASVGPERAAELYRAWIGHVLSALQPARVQANVVGCFDGGPEHLFQEWCSLVDDWRPQPPGGLGERLQAGFDAAGRHGLPTIAVGTDCLEVDAGLVAEAFTALRGRDGVTPPSDAVFGPAFDGGYYLVGTSRPLSGFFDGVRWSSEFTLSDHFARCRERGWSVAMLPRRHDIDTWDDWQAYLARRDEG